MVRRNGGNKPEHGEHALGLSEGGRCLGNPPQQRLCISLEHRQLVNQGGVEHGIRPALIGKDIVKSSLIHSGPLKDGGFRSLSPGTVISYKSAEEAVICGAGTVMPIQTDPRKRRDKDTEFHLPRNRFVDPLIKPMNPLNDNDISLPKLKDASPFPAAL